MKKLYCEPTLEVTLFPFEVATDVISASSDVQTNFDDFDNFDWGYSDGKFN